MGRDPPVGNPWSKGLSFVPSSGVNMFGLKVDLFKCFRQLNLCYFFSKLAPCSLPKTLFKSRSIFCPTVSNHTIHTFCRVVEQDFFKSCLVSNTNCVQNLSLNERTALNELMSDSDLIIKQGFGH